MTTISIQPGQPGMEQQYDPMLPLPYPFHVDADTGMIERQDFWRGEPAQLLGFQEGTVQRIVLYRHEWAKDPDSAIGLRPVFANDDGTMWSHVGQITSVAVSDD